MDAMAIPSPLADAGTEAVAGPSAEMTPDLLDTPHLAQSVRASRGRGGMSASCHACFGDVVPPPLFECVVTPPSDCNDNNHFEWVPMLPFGLDGTQDGTRDGTQNLCVLRSWHEALPPWMQTSLRDAFPTHQLADFPLPHVDLPPCDKTALLPSRAFVAFYKWYYALYDMPTIAHLLPPTTLLLPLTPSMKDALWELCCVGLEQGGGVPPNLTDCTTPSGLAPLFPAIRSFLKTHRTRGAFVKLSHKSAKNEFCMYAAGTVDDVFDNLVHSSEVRRSIDKSSALVLKPWNDGMRPASGVSEWRVFVVEGRVAAVCQNVLEPLRAATLDWGELAFSISGLMPALERLAATLPFRDAVLDVFWGEGGHLELIEANPGGAWHGSGAALFRWEEIRAATATQIPLVRVWVQ